MEFGIQFFPSVGPDQKSAEQYWGEALELTRLAEQLGFANVRTVEHYFHPYGGYSPDPLIFLSAAAAITSRVRLITGAVLPIFNKPLKLAGQIGMVDAISKGRVEIGFARAFLPHEFVRFGISMNESRARFDEGLEQIRRLLEEENVTAQGRFHSFENVTSLPRPTQKPRPPFWIATLSTEEVVRKCRPPRPRHHGHSAGRRADGGTPENLPRCLDGGGPCRPRPGDAGVPHVLRRDAGEGRGNRTRAAQHLSQVDRQCRFGLDVGRFVGGLSELPENDRDHLPGDVRSQIEKGAAWIGTPDDIRKAVAAYEAEVGGFESASLQVNFGMIPRQEAAESITLFAREVMPYFKAR